MADYTDYRALLFDGEFPWHRGSDTIEYDYITSTPPDYYSSGSGWQVDDIFFQGFQSLAMDAQQRALMEQAVAQWNDVANVNLVQGGGNSADIVIGSADFRDDSLFGFAWFPDPYGPGGWPGVSGDVWVNSGSQLQNPSGTGPMLGHTSWHTYLHEVGHALGLEHPNDRPNNQNTNAQFTVMSYVAHPSQDGLRLNDQSWPVTPMLWDIEAIQKLYGANTETHNTTTVYLGEGQGWDAAAERALQYGSDQLKLHGADGKLRDVMFTIWDGGGEDLLDASDFAQDAQIDLRAGRYSSIGGVENNIAVASHVVENGRTVNFIEQAWGGSGDDKITGNAASNSLRGSAGNDSLLGNAGQDTLFGNDGNDSLQGGRGRDSLYGGDGHDRLFGNKGADYIRGGAQGDVLGGEHGHDRLSGGAGNDRLWGHSGRDTLLGNAGNDRLKGGSGNDTINGGSGDDRLIGDAGADRFVFSKGHDRVLDFNITAGDHINLRRIDSIDDYEDLLANHLRETNEGVLIESGTGSSLLLLDVQADALSADQFLF